MLKIMKNLNLASKFIKSLTAILFITAVLFSVSFAQDGDSDGDGILDSQDLCPGEKGTKANKGCPEKTKQREQTQNVSVTDADLLKLTAGYAEEISIRDSKYKKLLEQYSPNLSAKLKRENLLSRKSEMTAVKQICTKVLKDFGDRIFANEKEFFSEILKDAEYRLKLVNTQSELVALTEKDSDSGLGDDFLNKVITDTKPQVKTETKTSSAIKTAKELNPNNEGKELFDAIAAGANERTESLIKSGMNLNYGEPNGGDSSLMKAIRERNNYIAIKLLEAGADPNFVPNEYGGSPIQMAVQMINIELVKLLINKYSVDLNTKGKTNGYTPLYWAAMFNQSDEITKLLLAAGANPNIFNSDGESPLSMAMINGMGNAVKNLLFEVSTEEIRNKANKRDATVGAQTRKKDADNTAERERAKIPTELNVRVDLQSDFLNKGYKFVAEGTTTLQGRNFNDKNQAVKQDIYIGYEYIFIIVTNQEIGWVVTIGDDGKFTSSNKPQEGFGKEKVPNSDLTSYFFKFGFDDKSGFIYFIPHGESWADVRWVLMRKKL